MKLDFYTKFILTVIAIGVLIPMVGNPPVTKNANAFVGGGEMIESVGGSGYAVMHLKNSKVRFCETLGNYRVKCGNWSN